MNKYLKKHHHNYTTHNTTIRSPIFIHFLPRLFKYIHSSMASLKSSILLFSFIVTLLALLPSGQAQAQDQKPSLPTLEQCWLSMEEILGCYSEIYRAFMRGKVGISFGPSCCLAINDITSNCWTQMLPNAPHIPPLLKNFCNHYASDAPTPSDEPADRF